MYGKKQNKTFVIRDWTDKDTECSKKTKWEKKQQQKCLLCEIFKIQSFIMKTCFFFNSTTSLLLGIWDRTDTRKSCAYHRDYLF